MRRSMRLAALGFVFPAACGGEPEFESVQQRHAALSIPGLTPVPCDGTQPTWDGSEVDLLLADAWADCTMVDLQTFGQLDLGAGTFADDRMQALLAKVDTTLALTPWAGAGVSCSDFSDCNPGMACSGQQCVPEASGWIGWYHFRNGLNACDPASGESADRVAVPIQGNRVRVMRLSPGEQAFDIREPLVNLCVAQTLRSRSPGAMGGEAILLSAEQQRELAEAVRERSQMALVGFAHQAALWSGGSATGNPVRLEALRDWIASPHGVNESGGIAALTPEEFAAFSKNLAIAAQLHSVASDEALRLMARSRSARLPFRTMAPTSRADAEWGNRSWHQRLLAGAYGGDPLSSETGGPWDHSEPLQVPGVYPGFWVMGWPQGDASWFPYAHESHNSPLVDQLRALAQRYDELTFETQEQSTGCLEIDDLASQDGLFERVELSLRKLHCMDPETMGVLSPPCEPDALMMPVNDADSFLWRYYRIERAHAGMLAREMKDAVGRMSSAPGACSGAIPGTLAVLGKPASDSLSVLPGASPPRVRLDPEARFVPRDVKDVLSVFTRQARLYLPEADELNPIAPLEEEGLSSAAGVESPTGGVYGPGFAGSAKRRFGALSAIAAARMQLRSAEVAISEMGVSDPRKENLEAFVADLPEINALLDSQVGATVASFKPDTVLQGDHLEVRGSEVLGNSVWVLSVDTNGEDPYWIPEAGEDLYAFAIPNEAYAADRLRAPAATIFGRGAASTLQSSSSHKMFARGTVGAPHRWTTKPSCAGICSTEGLLLPNIGSPFAPPTWTLAVWKGTDAEYQSIQSGTFTPEAGDVRVLASAVLAFPTNPLSGQYFSDDGALGDFVRKQHTAGRQLSEHAYDGFGLQTHWVPPYSAELLGGESGEGSAKYYLEAARASATQASGAVDQAMNGLLEQTKNEADVQGQVARSRQAMEQAQQSLCGASNPDCEVSLGAPRALDPAWYPALSEAPFDLANEQECDDLPVFQPASGDVNSQTDWDGFVENVLMGAPLPDTVYSIESNNTELAKRILHCSAKRVVEAFLATEFQLAEPVAPFLTQDSQPAFGEYSGGDLASAFITQWNVVKAPNQRLLSLFKSIEAAEARVDVASAIVARAEDIIQLNCGVAAFALAVHAGISVSWSLTGPSISFSPGPLIAQKRRCDEVLLDAAVVVKEETASIKESFSSAAAGAVGMTEQAGAIALSGADIASLINQADMATARAKLDEKIATDTQVTSFGIYRRVHDYDLWRAKALVENSRRYALAARRAIEARYVVDLSDMTAPEPFVASPASWADEIYSPDLSLPYAVGVSVSGPTSESGVYSNKVLDYVTNLEGFLTGYSAERPSAVALEDVDVVGLPGLSRDLGDPLTLTCDLQPEDCNVDSLTLRVSRSKQSWFVQCPREASGPNGFLEQGDWRAVPSPEAGGVLLACADAACSCGQNSTDLEERIEDCVEQCGVRPQRARLLFNLDPWGRLNGDVSEAAYAKRYNGRWQRLAVNLVGTGIRDCTTAVDPLECYNQSFMRYDLRHTGQAWVTDYAGIWQTQGLPVGVIEGGKALAAELWLDPLQDGWETSYIGAVARTEFHNRPLGGAYELEIHAGPEVRLDRLERVQLLVGTSYWVQQQ